MSSVIRWLFRIGITCGALAAMCALLIALDELGGVNVDAALESKAIRIGTGCGLAFMWIGFVMLINAIRQVAKMWRTMSSFGRFISVLGLLLTTTLGGYIFYYFHTRSAFSPTASAKSQ